MTKAVIGNKEESTKKADKKAVRDKAGKFLKRRAQFPLMELRKAVKEKQESFQRKEQFP